MAQLAKLEEFLNKLNKERNSVKKNLHTLFKKADLNTYYLEDIVSIQEIRYQQIYSNCGLY